MYGYQCYMHYENFINSIQTPNSTAAGPASVALSGTLGSSFRRHTGAIRGLLFLQGLLPTPCYVSQLRTVAQETSTAAHSLSSATMQSSAHINENHDNALEPSSDDDPINRRGYTKLRVTAATLFAIGISPYFGVRTVPALQGTTLLLDVLYLVPFLSFCDEAFNWVWTRQPVRFFAGGRVVWLLLALRGISWSQAFLTAFYQTVS